MHWPALVHMFTQARSCLSPAPKTAPAGWTLGLKWLLRRKKAALRRLFKSSLRITSWRQQLVQLGQRQERQLEQRQEQRQEQQRQQLVQVRVLVQQLVLVLEELLSYRKLPERKLQR